MNYDEFFRRAFGRDSDKDKDFKPFDYQRRLAREPWPDLLDVPTGMGKTAGVILAWLWKRREKNDTKTPRRLVYCLPMRVLVEQTYENTIGWLDRLGLLAGKAEWEDAGNGQGLKSYVPRPEEDKLPQSGWAAQHGLSGTPIAVHLLMGGAERTDWITWPERDTILIGTQDMLLSRALNRGYAAGRARWPMDFGLVNNDCLWVFDEVQLMSMGLATSLQLDAWRKSLRLRGDDGFPKDTKDPVARPCRSLWMSATTARHWLDSAVDWRPHAAKAWKKRHCLTKADLDLRRVKELFSNKKNVNGEDKEPIATLKKPKTQEGKPNKADAKDKTGAYVSELASAIAEKRSKEGLTLVIVNTVERAVDLYEKLRERKNLNGVDLHLIHSRFRPMERERWRSLFSNRERRPRIIVSTQVVEAGVDVSAEVLFTELAPWASLVQRFGRCARFPGESGTVYWMDVATHESNAKPYELEELQKAKEQMQDLSDVGLQKLKEIKDTLDQPGGTDRAKGLFPYDPRFVPRDKDLFDLFDTTPDLTGADVDISRYIRDGQELDVQVFWREIDGNDEPSRRDRPDRRELCPVAFYRFREQMPDLLKGGRRIWRWNYRTGWEQLTEAQAEMIYPGQVVLLEKSCGGYDSTLGWTGNPKSQNFELLQREQQPEPDDMPNKLAENDAEEDGEPLSQLRGWVKLSDHSWHVCEQMGKIGKELLAECELKLPKLAARWHDRGKAHEAFVANLKPEFLEQARQDASILGDQPAAKAPREAWQAPLGRRAGTHDGGNSTSSKRRPGFRHELASALAILETLRRTHPDHKAFEWPEGLDKSWFAPHIAPEPASPGPGPAARELAALSKEDFDLLLYLVAAHHGKVRLSLRSSPDDARTDVPDPCPSDKRQARGVRDNDPLPACKLPDENGQDMEVPQVALNLDPMELGLSARYGPSWRERMQGLLERLGPFRLAYLEALLRVADWRASRQEDNEALAAAAKGGENDDNELDRSHPSLAPPPAGGAAPHPPRQAAAQGGAEHGVRGRAGEPTNVGTGTRPPHAATRYLNTTLGVISYAELAPHLATRVAKLQESIAAGDFDGRALDDNLIRELHGRICGDLTPDIAGRWRTHDVVVGDHEPPAYPVVPQRMRGYALDLQERLKSLPAEPDDLWLETLAFAEGRLLGIHPFADFNGRVTRVFVDLLTRNLQLPDVDPTPDPGEPTARYLAALRAADRNDWRPLMDIWRERFEREDEK